MQPDYFIMLYLSRSKPLLRYGILHWTGVYPTSLTSIVMAQCYALIRNISKRKFDHVTHMFKELDTLNLNQIYMHSDCNCVYNKIHYSIQN